MMLLGAPGQRGKEHDLGLGASTAAVAGMVNVCSVIAFFAFASNVTGHAAIFAEELVKGHWHQVIVVVLWLSLFLFGAFVANASITALGERRPVLGRAFPLVLLFALLVGVGYYGTYHYFETLRETENLVGILLFAMGLQNGMVATVSNGVVKTTHLTGLSTDLGIELSMFLQRRFRSDDGLRFKLKLHIVIFAFYILGGVLGGALFLSFGFKALYLAGFILSLILAHDLVMLWLPEREVPVAAHHAQKLRPDEKGIPVTSPANGTPAPSLRQPTTTASSHGSATGTREGASPPG
jgi:uncharacterized membrane protein YoaK (UPF0700 family)